MGWARHTTIYKKEQFLIVLPSYVTSYETRRDVQRLTELEASHAVQMDKVHVSFKF